jgi:hypothetical protein
MQFSRRQSVLPGWSGLGAVAAFLLLLAGGCSHHKPLAPPGDVTPPDPVRDLSIEVRSATVVLLSWTAPGDDSTAGKASAYEVRYGDVPITEQTFRSAQVVPNVPRPDSAGTRDSVLVAGLGYGTTWYFALKTSDEASNASGLSNVVTISTLSWCRVNSGAGIGDTDPALVARADHMFREHGVTIADSLGDWIWTGHAEDNSSPYPVPFADLTGATFAVDANYLYVRLTVAGVYPRTEDELPWYGQDQIRKLGVNIGLDTDNNASTGSPGDGGSEVLLGIGMMMTPTCGWMDVYEFWYGPTGIEWPEEQRWEHANNRNLIVAAWGGVGFDYCIMVYPAGVLGVRPGQTIAVNSWNECASLQYPQHATVDVLGSAGLGSHVVVQLPN